MRPQHAQPVVVRLPGREDEVRAYVDAASEASVTLVLAVREQAVGAEPGSPAVVEYSTPSGIHRLTGTVGRPGPDPSVLEVERLPPSDEVIQRRAWARVDAAVPVEVRFEDADTGAQATVAVNLSGGGALIEDPLGLPMGEVVHLSILLDQARIDATGAVVRETATGDKGVQITTIADADRERIIRFVTARQRNELARRRRVPT